MKKLYLKIKDSSGISILMAMLLLLTITMVSSVVVASSVTSASKSKYDRKQLQAYMYVSSAAEYMQHEFENCTLVVDGDYNVVGNSDCPFTPLMTNALKTINGYDSGSGDADSDDAADYSHDFYLRLNYDPDKNDVVVYPVKVKFRMQMDETTAAAEEPGTRKSADTVISFSVYDPYDVKDKDNPEIDYWLTLYMRGDGIVGEDGNTVYNWRNGSIYKGSGVGDYFDED